MYVYSSVQEQVKIIHLSESLPQAWLFPGVCPAEMGQAWDNDFSEKADMGQTDFQNKFNLGYDHQL